MSLFERFGRWRGFSAKEPSSYGLSGDEIEVVLVAEGWVVVTRGWKSMRAYTTPGEALEAYAASRN